jgi:hypothetical protein
MSSTITPTATTSIQDLTKSIMQKFDANGDGQFSVDEFSNFLNAFVKSMTGSGTSTASATSTIAGATGVGTPALLSNGVSSSSSRLNDPLPPCPPGWNQEKWVNLDHKTVKYTAGRVMARYSPSDWLDQTKRDQILADFRASGLNPTAAGKDCVDFNDGAGLVDIVQAASAGGKAWQWLNTQ